MSKIIQDLKLGLDEDLAEKLAYLYPSSPNYRLLRRSVDARKRHDVHEVVSVEIFDKTEIPNDEQYELSPIEL